MDSHSIIDLSSTKVVLATKEVFLLEGQLVGELTSGGLGATNNAGLILHGLALQAESKFL